MTHILVSYLKELYSVVVRRLSKKNKSKPVIKRVCYLMSFPNNNQGLIEAISHEKQVIVLYKKNCLEEVKQLKSFGIECINLDTVSGFIKGINCLCQSQVIIADNYFAFLGDITFKQNQTVYQLWHATGAIKQFGLEDKSAVKRSEKDKHRFRRVYESFDYVFVASEKMADVFKRSYGFSKEQILFTGFPRTDRLCQRIAKPNSNKRRVLYLPTYRENEPVETWLLDIKKVADSLKDEGLLQVKLHPHVELEHVNQTNVDWISSHESADEYIIQADVLITDYSSVAFDFTLANPTGQLIMYWPDEMKYRQVTGIQPNIEADFPQSVAHTTDDVIKQLTNHPMLEGNKQFNALWNTYNDGQATNRVLDEIKEVLDGEK